ncbi:DUF1028 domain-containing protein [Mycolicibacterium fortuitum]|uniref:DUF1028 domain-containing protein n=2 Tax=Mycolicibacterium TaxID=1866885 RepID=A0AAE4VGQ0_MYCFO|nr:DUF1028 domain-containing protein [Mycolicibacterium fortuitum]MCV7143422.1 DUF1028 domain-containing protein [Mycolicibacterium fortuitum]MDV7193974.1 DUF1028 domain-containing protein [Mycolicibacterium fortuitum]MDV7207505.1 DUF1028 domain-containing protein [Mycolicibacterium fortuitum]MDV7229377.1 DUF1028 domain-containing protein [Mycolicibacterium fortuitum]MDV7261017.1 DUF1028 domain-containing protein [Mycolicibacterium fortuitum]
MTYSIVARDAATGHLGVGAQTHFFGVGTLLPWAEAGVGAVATQAFVNVDHGPHGLDLLRAGMSAATAVAALVADDPDSEYRQLGVVDAAGGLGTYTGTHCAPAVASASGHQVTVQGNMLAGTQVAEAALAAYEAAKGDLAERILAGLMAADAAGGDVRGAQSAVLRVVSGRRSATPWNEVVVDLRVDDHPQPLTELSRLLPRSRAFRAVGAVMFQRGLTLGPFTGVDPDELTGRLDALVSAAATIGPDNREADFWRAILLARCGRHDEAGEVFADVVAFRPGLLSLLEGLAPLGFLDGEALSAITSRIGTSS